MSTVETIGLILLILGLILVFIEMILPGFGVPGISGVICLVVGVGMMTKTLEQTLTLAIIVVVAIAVMMTIVVLFFHRGRDRSPIKLQEKMEAPEGFLNESDIRFLIGKDGVASTDLRPAGKCDIDGITFDVRSEGQYINKGSKIKIVRVEGNTLIVK